MLSGFFPLDEASNNDWRFPKMQAVQLKPHSSTTEAVYGWYRRSARHLTREVVHLLDGLLTIDPHKRLTMAHVREHNWVLDTTFSGATASDQGTFNTKDFVGDEEERVWRGG